MDLPDNRREPTFPFISQDADDALELIFEHPDGITADLLAYALDLPASEHLIDELAEAGIAVRVQRRNATTVYLPPLKL